jgi:uncharacterized damage-inducible protein DinB
MQPQLEQTSLAGAIICELLQESEATRRLLQIVPEDKLTWRPHPKAMSLGQLALHIAGTPGGVAEGTVNDMAAPPDFVHPEPQNTGEIITAFEEGLNTAKRILSVTSNEQALSQWKILDGETVLIAMPRVAFWRTVMLNHLYHHRGQLSTYLRILDVPLPAVYGQSADSKAFG